MTGGLLNLVSYGQSNILIYGNPTKTLFKVTYKHITNFGMQRIRVDSNTSQGQNMSLTEEQK